MDTKEVIALPDLNNAVTEAACGQGDPLFGGGFAGCHWISVWMPRELYSPDLEQRKGSRQNSGHSFHL